MIEGVLSVFQLKLEFKNERDHVAQALLELVCESEAFFHKSIKIKRGSGIQ
jgi:hypothetical protein